MNIIFRLVLANIIIVSSATFVISNEEDKYDITISYEDEKYKTEVVVNEVDLNENPETNIEVVITLDGDNFKMSNAISNATIGSIETSTCEISSDS